MLFMALFSRNKSVMGLKEGELITGMDCSLNNKSIPSLKDLLLFVSLPFSLDIPNTTFAKIKKSPYNLSFECWCLKFINFFYIQNIDSDIVILSVLFNDFKVECETRAIKIKVESFQSTL